MSPTSRAVALPPASHHYRLRAGPSPSTWQFDLSTMMSPSHHPTHLRAGPSPSSLHLRASDCYRLYEHRACAARCLSGRGPGSGRGGRRGQSWSERGGSSRGERRAEADEVAVVETNVDEDARRGASASARYSLSLHDCRVGLRFHTLRTLPLRLLTSTSSTCSSWIHLVDTVLSEEVSTQGCLRSC